VSRIPWLDPSGHKKTINEDQLQNVNNALPKFINQHVTNDTAEIVNISDDNNDNVKCIKETFLIY